MSFGFDIQIAEPISSAINSWSSAAIGDRYSSKAEKRSLARQYAYAQQYALNSPSWNVEGLRRANLNPILAATDGAFSSPTVPSVSQNWRSADGDGGRLGVSIPIEKQREMMDAQIAAIKADKDLKEAQENNVKQDTENKHNTGGLSGAYGAANSVVNRALDSLSTSHPSGSSTSSDDVKSRHHPSDNSGVSSGRPHGFKPNYSDNTAVGRVLNDLDANVERERRLHDSATGKRRFPRRNRNLNHMMYQ